MLGFKGQTLLAGIFLTACILGSLQAQQFNITAEDGLFTPQNAYRAKFDENSYIFDFPSGPSVTKGAGGAINSLNIGTDLGLFGTGVAQALLTLKPCGINTPHTHPRSTEIAHVIKGTITFGLVEENGDNSRVVVRHLSPGESIFLPQGYVHYQHNFGKEEAQFVAGFSTPDPGTVTIATNYFRFPPVTLAASLGISEQRAAELAKTVTRQDTLAQGPGGATGCLNQEGPKIEEYKVVPESTNKYGYPQEPDDGTETGYPYRNTADDKSEDGGSQVGTEGVGSRGSSDMQGGESDYGSSGGGGGSRGGSSQQGAAPSQRSSGSGRQRRSLFSHLL